MKTLSMLLALACAACFAVTAVAIGCAGDDDDDDSAADDDDATGDDDDAGCTQQTLCEYAVECGYFGSVEECVSASEGCANLAAQTECSCACLDAADEACSDDAYQCGGACVEANCP
ncbi:MAG: hypothetical protein IT350_13695 [Deltaproteobacteria bacterium]|nr:hypothetical protein [Deltaproteobacteria bacterium]